MMKSASESLGAYLTSEQQAQNLGDDAFAALLGIAPEVWQGLRDSGEPWPSVVLARVLLRYPDALSLAAEEVRRRLEPGEGWRWWHAAAADGAPRRRDRIRAA